MIKPDQWDNEHHEVLYALFIVQANTPALVKYKDNTTNKKIVMYAMFNYALQWEDRAVCEEEFEGLIYWDKGERQFAVRDDQYELRKEWCGKVKFRFVED